MDYERSVFHISANITDPACKPEKCRKIVHALHNVPPSPLKPAVKLMFKISEIPFLILMTYAIYWLEVSYLAAHKAPLTVWLNALVAGVLVGIGLNANAYRALYRPLSRERKRQAERRQGIESDKFVECHSPDSNGGLSSRSLRICAFVSSTTLPVTWSEYETEFDIGMMIRFFIIPFGVSSLSGITNNARDEFLLVFPRNQMTLAVFILIPSVCVVRLYFILTIPLRPFWKAMFLNACLTLVFGVSIVEPMKHDVIPLNPKTMAEAFHLYRDRFPGGILYYNDAARASEFLEDVWNPLAKDLKGMAKIGAIDCKEFSKLCKQDLSEDQQTVLAAEGFAVQAFPPIPRPPFALSNVVDKNQLKKNILKHLPAGQYQEIEDLAALKKFLNQDVTLPKVFLYSNTKVLGSLWHSLIHNLGDRMQFARIKREDLAAALKIPRDMPVIAVKSRDTSVGPKGLEIFNGNIKSFHEVHDWLNVRSETFVRGGGVDPNVNVERNSRNWLFSKYPELTKASHKDLCINLGSELCGILVLPKEYVNEEKREPNATIMNIIDALSEQVKKPALRYSWVDASREPKLMEQLGITDTRPEPVFIILNPHKRLRFAAVEKATGVSSVLHFIEQIKAGNGRFTPIKGGKLEFASMSKREEL